MKKPTDKQRLDFMTNNPRHVVYRRGIQSGGPIEYLARTRVPFRWSLHNSLRRAIDAAMKASKEKK